MHRIALHHVIAEFQSAPLTDVRGDDCRSASSTNALWFQSAPLTDVRGDWPSVIALRWRGCVSIRSPHGCKGRSAADTIVDQQDAVSIRSPHGCKGRYDAPRDCVGCERVSIRSPHGCKGRSERVDFDPESLLVSIRSPHGCKGRCICCFKELLTELFQSAPLTDVRGDRCLGNRLRTGKGVSIRSPHGCKGR